MRRCVDRRAHMAVWSRAKSPWVACAGRSTITRCASTCWFARQAREIVVGPDVAVDQQKGRIAQQGQRVQQAAAGFQRCVAFVGIDDAQAPACAVARASAEIAAPATRC